MDIGRIAWRNIGRNKRRSVLSGLAVAFAVAVLTFSMALQRGSYTNMIDNTVQTSTGHLQIQHQAYWPDRNMWKKVSQPTEVMASLKGIPAIQAMAPRIQAPALVSTENRSFGALIKGIQPNLEAHVSTLANSVTEGRFLEKGDDQGALIGYMLAKNLGIGIGDEIVFIGQGADGSLAAGKLIVRALIKTGINELDRTTIGAQMRMVQEAFSMFDSVSEIVILLDHDENRDTASNEIKERLQKQNRTELAVLDWSTLLPGVEESIKIDWNTGLILYFVLVMVVGFGIANTFLMAFIERIHEFGVLLALGMRPMLLSFMLYLESILLTAIGIVVGLTVGIIVVSYFRNTGIHFGAGSEEIMAQYGMSPVIYPEISWLVINWSVGIVLCVTLVLAIYPALKVRRLKPVEALHHA